MKITLFTSNKNRHNYLINLLSEVSDELYVIQECVTIFPGIVLGHYQVSPIMKKYFENVNNAQSNFFGNSYVDNKKKNIKILPMVFGDLNQCSLNLLSDFLKSDVYVVFGSSYIKGELVDFLVKQKAINIHAGVSPYYRGSGTNVWPLINGEPEMVGATFMYLDEGIDTGQIIHQIGADFYIGDSPHTIGNRLIKKMTRVYAELIVKFNKIENIKQPDVQGLFYLQKDFNREACRKLYNQFNNGLIERFLNSERISNHILKNPGIYK